MKKLAIALGAAAVVSLFGATQAHAAESPTAGHGSVGALVGYGFDDALKLGLGVRGGYTLPMNLYLGGTFIYHLGSNVGGGDVNIYYFGVEGGYDIAAGPVVVRPYLGLGPLTAKLSSPGFNSNGFDIPASDASNTKIAFWPGATVLYPIDNFFVGGDARFLVVENYSALNIFATAGLQF